MICPSLIYVGPRTSTALRKRSETSAWLLETSVNFPRFFFTYHGARAPMICVATVMTRNPGGSRRGVVRAGTSALARERSPGASDNQRTLSRSSTQGAFSVNEPQLRSPGVSFAWPNSVTLKVCPCCRKISYRTDTCWCDSKYGKWFVVDND